MPNNEYSITITPEKCTAEFRGKKWDLNKKNGYYVIELPMRKKLPQFAIEWQGIEQINGIKLLNATKWGNVILEEFDKQWKGVRTVYLSLRLVKCVSHLPFSLLTSSGKKINLKISFSKDIVTWYPCKLDGKKLDFSNPATSPFPRTLTEEQGDDYSVESLADAIISGKIAPGVIWIRGGTAHGKTTLLMQLKEALNAKSEEESIKMNHVELDFYHILINTGKTELLDKYEIINEQIQELQTQSLDVGDNCKVVVYVDEMDVFFELFRKNVQSATRLIDNIFNQIKKQNDSCDYYFIVTDFMKYDDRASFFTAQSLSPSCSLELQPIQQKDIKAFIEEIPLSDENICFLSNRVERIMQFSGGNTMIIVAILSEAVQKMWDGNREHEIREEPWSSLIDGDEVKSAIKYLCYKKCDEGKDGQSTKVFRGNIEKKNVVNMQLPIVDPLELKKEYRAGLLEIEAIKEYDEYNGILQQACKELEENQEQS